MTADFAPEETRRPTRQAISALFTAGFVAAVICCAVATALALYSPAGPASTALLITVIATLALTAGLAVLAVLRLFRVLTRKVGGAPTPRLHLRFVALFSFAAVTPAVLMAVFFGVLLSRGLEAWFGERVEASVEASRTTSQFYVEQIVDQAILDIAGAAADFSNEEVQEQFATPEDLLAYLATYRAFTAAYVVDSSGMAFVDVESPAAPEFRPPRAEEFAAADLASRRFTEAMEEFRAAAADAEAEGAAGAAAAPVNDAAYVDVDQEAGVLRGLARLAGADDRYLYVVPDVNPDLFNALRYASNAIATFDEARAQRDRIEAFFFLIYFAAALLILSGSVWLALSAAGRVATPVGRLVEAADRVGRGDLTARVNVADDHDEVSALARAFNLMTGQIARQQQELIDANAESEGRRRLIEAVLLGVSAGVLSVDKAGVVRLANRSAEELLGAHDGALMERPLSDIAPALAEIAARARARPGGTVEEQIELARQGSTLVLNVRAAMDQDSEGERVVLTFDDITRLIAAQRNAAWRDVARRIAHEIKNPLTPIQLSAERLRRRYRPADESGAEVFDRCTDTIIRQVSDIGRMVDEFSAFARMPTPRIERAALQDLAQETVFARRVASPDIRVTLEAPEQPVVVHCDARLASQALANVLKNAAESLAERGVAGSPPAGAQIAVRILTRDGQGVVEVQDNGLGWPGGARERLTEPYMTTREHGTGLGLAIVQRIMEDHGGRLELDVPSDGSTGALVRLAFPLAQDTQGVKAAE